METNKIVLSESQLRSLISQEIETYLITEGFVTNLKHSVGNLKSNFNPTILASLLLGASTAAQPIAQAQSELSNDEQTQEFFKVVDQQQQKLQSFGLTDEAANKIVVSVLDGAKKTKEEEIETSTFDLADQEIAQIILDYQKEQLANLNDFELVKDIMIANFQKDIEQQGRSAIVGAAAKGGRLGAPTGIDSLLTGLGYEAQETLVAKDDESFIKLAPSKTGKGQSLKFNYMDLDTYWNDLVVDGSKIEQEMRKEGDITLPYHYYDTGGGAFMQSHIASQLQKENKFNKLRKRLNEIRGLYV